MKHAIRFITIFIGCVVLSSKVVHADTKFSEASSYLEVGPAITVDGKEYRPHFVHHNSNEPFLYVADTAWELLGEVNKVSPQSTKADLDYYLQKRKDQGFTAVMFCIIGPFSGTNARPDLNGNMVAPFTDGNAALNEAYAQKLDYVIDKAAELDLLTVILPVFGWNQSALNADLGTYLGNRYKSKNNIIWMMGGDMRAGDVNKSLWTNFAAKLKAADSKALVSFHPFGEGASNQSAFFGGQNDVLDFNTSQPSHGVTVPKQPYQFIYESFDSFAKPHVIGEMSYENINVNWFSSGRVTPEVVRRDMLSSILSWGNHTYGANEIQQIYFNQGDGAGFGEGHLDWKQAVDTRFDGQSGLNGAGQIGAIVKQLQKVDWGSLVPNDIQPFITSNLGSGNQHIVGGLSSSKDLAVVYLPAAGSVTVDMGKFTKAVTASWINPATGVLQKTTETITNAGSHTFAAQSGTPDDLLLLQAQQSTATPVPTSGVTAVPSVTVNPTASATITQVSCSKVGDLDCSGKVNAVDLTLFLSHFGSSDSQSDLDSSGKVNAADLTILLSKFGS